MPHRMPLVRIESVHVSLPKTVQFQGRPVETAIFKQPVSDRVRVGKLNLDGDRQADLSVHGGEHKAIYSYAAEHHAWWEKKLGRDLEPSQFGENLTTSGLDEGSVRVGDRFRFGTAIVEAVQPRLPCSKLGVRFGDPGIVAAFIEAGRWGIYFRVVEEGELRAGDEIVPLEQSAGSLTVYDVARTYLSGRGDRASLARLALSTALAPSWREWARQRLAEAGSGNLDALAT